MSAVLGVLAGLASNVVKNGPAYVQLGAETLDPNAIAMRKKLEADTARMETGDLGPSQAQRAKWLAAHSRTAQAQAAAQQAGLAQQAAASGSNRGGAYFKAQQDAGTAALDSTAQASGKIEEVAAQAADQEKQDIQGRQETERQRMWKLWGIGGAPTPVAQAVGTLPSDMISGAADGGAGAVQSMTSGEVRGVDPIATKKKKRPDYEGAEEAYKSTVTEGLPLTTGATP